MMTTISGTHETSIGQYIAGYWQRNADSYLGTPYSAMGWIKNGKLVAQAIFLDYTGSNIEIHVHAPCCISRRTIKDVYTYVFKQLKCNRLTAKLKEDNKNLLELISRLGFRYEFSQEAYYGTPDKPIDALVFKLRKLDALKWL